MIAPSIPKYTAALSSKAGLVDETLAALRYVVGGKSEDELRFAFLQEDLLGKDTHENRLTIWKRLHQRFFVDWKQTILLAKVINWISNYDHARLFIYYDFCLSEAILYDAVTGPVYERFSNGFSGVEISDLQTWLDSIQSEHPEVTDWSPQTRKKVLSNVLAVLRDFGLMSGKVRKTFERVYVPATLEVTGTVMVQLDSAGTVPEVTLNEEPPAVAVVTMPMQVPPTVSGAPLTRLAG